MFEVCGLEEGAEEDEDENGDDGVEDDVEEDVDANTNDEDEGENSTIVVTSHDTKRYPKIHFSQRQVHSKQTLVMFFFCAPRPALETSTSPGRRALL